MQRLNRAFAPSTVLVLLMMSGCGLSTAPVAFQDFQWLAVENANDVVEGMDAAAFGGDVAVLGQLEDPDAVLQALGELRSQRILAHRPRGGAAVERGDVQQHAGWISVHGCHSGVRQGRL